MTMRWPTWPDLKSMTELHCLDWTKKLEVIYPPKVIMRFVLSSNAIVCHLTIQKQTHTHTQIKILCHLVEMELWAGKCRSRRVLPAGPQQCWRQGRWCPRSSDWSDPQPDVQTPQARRWWPGEDIFFIKEKSSGCQSSKIPMKRKWRHPFVHLSPSIFTPEVCVTSPVHPKSLYLDCGRSHLTHAHNQTPQTTGSWLDDDDCFHSSMRRFLITDQVTS